MDRKTQSQLVAAARAARQVMFSLMLAEKAARARGPYTETYEKLDKALSAIDAGQKDEQGPR